MKTYKVISLHASIIYFHNDSQSKLPQNNKVTFAFIRNLNLRSNVGRKQRKGETFNLSGSETATQLHVSTWSAAIKDGVKVLTSDRHCFSKRGILLTINNGTVIGEVRSRTKYFLQKRWLKVASHCLSKILRQVWFLEVWKVKVTQYSYSETDCVAKKEDCVSRDLGANSS